MSGLEDLYKELILDHYRAPRNKGKLDPADIDLHRDNPLCGDEIHLYAQIEDGKVSAISFEGKGCSISQASVSMMTEKLKGTKVPDAEAVANDFRQLMHGETPSEERLGDLMALEGVQKYPVRIKCALLGWNAFVDGLKAYQEKHAIS